MPVRTPTYAEIRAKHRPRGIAAPSARPESKRAPRPPGGRYFAFLDETEFPVAPNDSYFVYGGMVVPLDEIGAIDSAIVQIRAAAGYPPEIPLKWSTPGGPVTPQAHRLAKAQLLASCHQSRCELFVSICHSGVSRGASGSDGRILWGASGVLRAIHGFLEEYDSTAMVLVDRFPGVNPTPFLEEKAIRGLVYEAAGGQPARDEPLPRFSSFSASSAKASRLSSVVDVPLGAFGHCLDPKRTDAARLAAEVMPLLSRDATGSVYYRGVSVYPTRSKIQDYRAAHSRLESTLSGYGVAGVPVYED